MTDTIRDLIEIVQRLELGRSRPPAPLIRRGNPARAGPKRAPDTLRRKESHHGPPGASGCDKPIFNWRSKGMKP